MEGDFAPIFAGLRAVLASRSECLSVTKDTAGEYTLETRSPSPFPQHKGHPMFFASARIGKAYVSFHLMPLYMCPELTDTVSPALKKRMQGKTCFNFKTAPAAGQLAELRNLTDAGIALWRMRAWL